MPAQEERSVGDDIVGGSGGGRGGEGGSGGGMTAEEEYYQMKRRRVRQSMLENPLNSIQIGAGDQPEWVHVDDPLHYRTLNRPWYVGPPKKGGYMVFDWSGGRKSSKRFSVQEMKKRWEPSPDWEPSRVREKGWELEHVPPQVVLEEDSWGGRDCWYPALCFACGEPGILSREAVQKANPGLDPSHDVSFEQLERALSSCSRFTLQRRPALHQDYLGLLQSRGSFVGIACVEPEGHARDAHYFGYDGYRRVLYYGDGATHAFGVDDDDVKTRRGAKAFFDAIDFKHFTAVRQVCTKAGKRHISPL